jgi:signal transduction histidine kinase
LIQPCSIIFSRLCFLLLSLLATKAYSQNLLWANGYGLPAGAYTVSTQSDLPLPIQTGDDILEFTKEMDISLSQKTNIQQLIDQGKELQWQFPDRAMVLLDSALRESIFSGYATGAAMSKIQTGLTLLGQGDFDASMEEFKKAYPYILRSSVKRRLISALYINIGASYSYQNKFEKAFEYYYAVLQYMLVHPSDKYNLIMTYNNIADVLIRMEQYKQAEYYLNIGEQLMLKEKTEDIYGFIWSNKADLALAQKDLETCIHYCMKAMDISIKYKEIEVQQSVYLVEAKYYLATNQPEKAIVSLKKIMKASEATYPLYSLIAPYYTLGIAYCKAHDYRNAELVLVKALEKAQKTGILTDKLKALATLTTVYSEQGRYKDAILQQRNYINLRDSINSIEKLKIVNELEVKFRTAEKDKKIIEKQLLIEKQKRDLDQKNLQMSRVMIIAIIIVVVCIALYFSLKAKNKIVAMKAQMEGEENERSRIARDLHDGIGGQLAVIKMILSSWPEEKKKQVVSLLNETSEQVRQTAHNLMPDFIKGIELEEALTLYVESLNHNFPQLKIDLQIYCKFNIADHTSKLSIYRMVQEILQNIINHAKASVAVIQVFEQHGKFQLLIEDNGIGFDKDKVKAGLGLSNLEARVRMLHGKIQINSSPGRGTTINIEISK